MAEIIIYTKSSCPYCASAKALLSKKKAAFREIEITGNAALRDEMIAKAHGRTTVPQIFIGSRHVGGCDDLYELDASGGLDRLLAA